MVFSEPVTGVDAADFSVGGSATGFAVSGVTGSGTTYVVTVSGTAVTDGTVTLSMRAGGAQDAAGNTNNASTSTDSSVTYDGTPPSVSVTSPYTNETLTGTTTTVGGLVADGGTGVASVGVVIQYTDGLAATTYYWNGIGWQTTPYLNPATIAGASWTHDWAFSPARQQGDRTYTVQATAVESGGQQRLFGCGDRRYRAQPVHAHLPGGSWWHDQRGRPRRR